MNTSKKNCILICRCGAGLVSGTDVDSMVKSLDSLDADIFELDNLCALSVNDGRAKVVDSKNPGKGNQSTPLNVNTGSKIPGAAPAEGNPVLNQAEENRMLNQTEGKQALRDIGSGYENIIMVACYPRAVKSLLEQGRIDIGKFHTVNFRESKPGEILPEIRDKFNVGEGTPNYHVMRSGLDVPAWYPVIDTSRCSLCGKCAKFCLFGVYKFDKKSLQVASPLSCKNNCPACARICPESAIIFPRWPENSPLSGAEPGEKKTEAEDSLHEKLNRRNMKRKVIFRKDFAGKVREDHIRAIEELKKENDTEN